MEKVSAERRKENDWILSVVEFALQQKSKDGAI